MALDVAGITARLKRVPSTAPPAVPSWPAPPAPQAPTERPWLTAEAVLPSVTAQGGGLESNTLRVATPPPPVARVARRAKRRRWPRPTSPTERTADRPLRMGGGGLADAYSRPIGAAAWETSGRPRPIGHTATETADLIRAGFHPWSARSTGEPPPSTSRTLRERVAHLWYGDAL